MAYLHNGDQKPTDVFSFYPCLRDDVYIDGLKEGESILSEHPYFHQNANGFMAIDDRYTSFSIIQDDTIIKTLHLKWNDQCATQTSVIHENMENPQFENTAFDAMLVIGIGVLTILIARRIFHVRS